MIRLTGVDLADGRERLRSTGLAFWWRGWSLVLLSGAGEHLPEVRLQPVDGPDLPSPDDLPGAGFGLQSDQGMRNWARRTGLTLLLPDEKLTTYLADKSFLPHLASAAGVPVPACEVVDRACPDDADRVARSLGQGPLVVQRTPNNLTGTGTRLVPDGAALRVCLDEWSGQRLKVAAYVEGVDLTVSGCVTDRSTFVSGVSHQLVGVPALTPTWGAHCGNQLVDDGDLVPGVMDQCTEIAVAVGDVLREYGFRGLFGLDLVLDRDGRVVLLEINPRIQSVTSLLNYVEAAAGLLPLPGVHLLAHLGLPARPAEAEVTAVRRLSQVIVTARRHTQVTDLPSGRYRIVERELHPVSPDCQGAPPAADEVLVWPAARQGVRLNPGDRLLVAMFGRHVAPVGPARGLDEWAAAVIEPLRGGHHGSNG